MRMCAWLAPAFERANGILAHHTPKRRLDPCEDRGAPPTQACITIFWAGIREIPGLSIRSLVHDN